MEIYVVDRNKLSMVGQGQMEIHVRPGIRPSEGLRTIFTLHDRYYQVCLAVTFSVLSKQAVKMNINSC